MNYIKIIRKIVNYYIIVKLSKIKNLHFGKGCIFHGNPIIQIYKNSNINIGSNCVFSSRSTSTALGVNHPVVIRTLTENSTITIGNDVGISGGTICAAKSVKIGSNCLVGANVTIVDTDFHSLNPENRRYNKNITQISTSEVVINDNVFLGTNSIILKGVTIGENSIIGAGAVVGSNVKPNSIVAGNPATFIREII